MDNFLTGVGLVLVLVFCIADNSTKEEYLKGEEVCSINGGVVDWDLWFGVVYKFNCKDGAVFQTDNLNLKEEK